MGKGRSGIGSSGNGNASSAPLSLGSIRTMSSAEAARSISRADLEKMGDVIEYHEKYSTKEFESAKVDVKEEVANVDMRMASSSAQTSAVNSFNRYLRSQGKESVDPYDVSFKTDGISVRNADGTVDHYQVSATRTNRVTIKAATSSANSPVSVDEAYRGTNDFKFKYTGTRNG